MIKIRAIPAAELSADQLTAWSALQRCDPALSNPFFRPEFTQAVATERCNVEVAVWEQAGEPVGFLPFERSRRNHGKPVGSHINECQGAIARSGVDWSPQAVLASAGLSSWRFDHVPSSQTVFAPFQHVVTASPYLDISGGQQPYANGCATPRSRHIEDVERRGRKAAREHGALRLEMNETSVATLRRLLEWKIDQCRRTRVPCNYELAWVVRLFERLLAQWSPELSGSMFSLYFGDRPAAVFTGLRARDHVHGLVFGFDRELGKYSPGSQLLLQMASAAAAQGIKRIDLGKGGEQYKAGYSSASDCVTEGAVFARPVSASLHRRWFRAKDRLRSSSLRAPVRRVRRWMLAARMWLGFQE